MSDIIVSFVVPTYNRINYLKKTINSILMQSNKNFELIVAENNCNDETLEWLKDQYNIKVVHHDKKVDMFTNWNSGIREAIGKYVIVLSDDDIASDNMVSEISKLDKKYNNIGMIMFNHTILNEKDSEQGKYISKYEGFYDKGEAFKLFSLGVNNRVCGIAFNREQIENLGCFDEKFDWTAADSKLIQQMAIISSVYFVEEKINLPSYRIWSNSLTNEKFLSNEWHKQIKIWVDDIYEFSKEKIGYNFSDERNRIMMDNYLAAIQANLNIDNMESIQKFIKEMPKINETLKFSILKFILSKKSFFKLYIKMKKEI
ncbi:glycosyltransferase family 2 protein [Clostridium intestinale]|uniref:Glycosyltransferase family 2 protein n=1 Tax=Clostridium intestinale TaxID=36845 RepID=A0A7D6ZWQ3_9CLOT|nr:glycosyltransferase family 2 protein [Clostridium intestinale]QLY79122.1 glycosyltransferase family 2 protein [Clostridium intestinale]